MGIIGSEDMARFPRRGMEYSKQFGGAKVIDKDHRYRQA